MSDQQHTGAITEDSISGAISKLMEHPEIIGAVASALGGSLGGSLGKTNDGITPSSSVSPKNAEGEDTVSQGNGEPDLAASLMPMISRLGSLGIGSGKDGGKGNSKHSALLCALKPYLSQNRRDAIDYMLKISQLSDIISKLR